MKNSNTFVFILLFVNAFAIYAQNQNSNNITESLNTDNPHELYKAINEKPENPLLIVNDFIWGHDNSILNLFEPNNIKEVEVLKDKDFNIYGDKGKNGVIKITLKDQNINTIEKFKEVFDLLNNNSKKQKISGMIYDSDNKPISNVNISNLNSKESFRTDSNGNYSLIAYENDILVFNLNGFKTKIIKVKTTNINIFLDTNPKSEIYIR
ncbi:carboxypeptidase-like regulatory domain-containing protein [Flavobacterium flavipallidum]|uniref:Carboxypeptidase-like regulatory domain-containing protein n=1 Tax=Flavobacterium flavipallidum TaxID=3139140 RepID=A0ABU9HJB5_9FLAO